MTSPDPARICRQEAADLLEQLEQALLDLERTPTAADLVNTARAAAAAATPTIRLAVETIPSLAPSTAARSQPMRATRWLSECRDRERITAASCPTLRTMPERGPMPLQRGCPQCPRNRQDVLPLRACQKPVAQGDVVDLARYGGGAGLKHTAEALVLADPPVGGGDDAIALNRDISVPMCRVATSTVSMDG